MYIIKTTSKSKKDSSLKYYTYRLVESVRVGAKVKRETLLNLGADFNIEQSDWSILSKRIDEIINKVKNAGMEIYDFSKIATWDTVVLGSSLWTPIVTPIRPYILI